MEMAFKLKIDEQLSLVQPSFSMATEVFKVLDKDREHLREFLDFVDNTKSPEDEKGYIKLKLDGYLKETDRLFFIAFDDEIIGSIDLHFMSLSDETAEIGYWMSSAHCGKNIATKAVRAVCELAFAEMGLNRLTIVADVTNLASNRVAEKSGFRKEGTLKQAKKLYDEFTDLNTYALLKSEFIQI
ncbi:GNAT family N-acetyltransferase [Listeria kieliensis]|uniref:Acetyltransferase n=1 Tax=Listeria kieliensis TaxID=1621700 RepID=A0A3D8TP16_9LIST|nr:GNAT family protein [Listeria kieliensis]RDX00618.1 acetyltransferase [Listeria kieliensis]